MRTSMDVKCDFKIRKVKVATKKLVPRRRI